MHLDVAIGPGRGWICFIETQDANHLTWMSVSIVGEARFFSRYCRPFEGSKRGAPGIHVVAQGHAVGVNRGLRRQERACPAFLGTR